MTTNEFYYLVLVIGAFGAFAAGLSVATIQYSAWLRQARGHGRVAPEFPVGLVPARASATARVR